MAFIILENVGFILYTLTCLATLTLIGRIVYFFVLHPLAKFPGPLLAKFGDGYWYYALLSGGGHRMNYDWHKRYGPIVRITPNHLSFNDHFALKTIYGFGTGKVTSMAKDPRFSTPEVDHSMNIVNECDKNEHARMRRMLSSAFSTSNVIENEDTLIRRTNEFIAVIRDKIMNEDSSEKGIDIFQHLNHLTFEIMGEMSFGESWDPRLEEQPEHRYHWAEVIVNTTYMNDVMRAVVCIPGLFSILEWFPPAHSKRTLYRHAEYATEHTRARLSLQSERKDFMYHILHSKGPSATPKEIASHFNVIMMAGAVTTGTFLTGVLYYLYRNRQALENLQDEIRSEFPDPEAITSKRLLKCVYLNAVVEEGLRIYPPAGAAHLSRIVPKGGCEIAGSFIPEGTRVSVHGWSIVRDPTNFHEPSQFLPERWIRALPDGQKGDKLEISLPFSYGPRGCIGKNLAYVEMRMILARLFWKFDLCWMNLDEVDWERDSKGYTLWHKPELRCKFKERVT